MDDNYYSLFHSGTELIAGVNVLKPQYILLLKAKAWLDLKDRETKGEKIDSKTITKRRKDVIRLFQILDPIPEIELPSSIVADLTNFLSAIEKESINTADLGLKNTPLSDVVLKLREKFGIGT